MKALYHQDASTRVTLDCLTKPKGGKVDLGYTKEVLIAECPISKDGAPGTCTLVEDDGADAAKKAADEAAAAAAKKAADEAAAAAAKKAADEAAAGKK